MLSSLHIGGFPICKCMRSRFDPWAGKIPWRRKWQPPLVFLPRKSHGQRSLTNYNPWGRKRVRHNLAKLILFFFYFFFLTLQYCIGFAIYQNESATGIHVFPILNPPSSSLPIPSLWVVPVHQPQTSSIVHQTWTNFNPIRFTIK